MTDMHVVRNFQNHRFIFKQDHNLFKIHGLHSFETNYNVKFVLNVYTTIIALSPGLTLRASPEATGA